MNSESQSPNKAIIAVIVIALLALVGGLVYALRPTENSEQVNDTTNSETTRTEDSNTTQSTEPSDSTATTVSSYKDGTYEATGSYSSPGGQESVEVSLTISGGKVTDSTVTSLAKNPTSKQYQSRFISGYKSEVVGKSVDEIELDAVSGSSLTPNGFNQALEQIKSDAAA